ATESPTPEALIELGKQQLQGGNMEESLKTFQKAETLIPNSTDSNVNAEVYNWLGILSYERKEYDKAYDYWKKSLELNPNAPQALMRVALLNMTQGNLDDAVKMLKR